MFRGEDANLRPFSDIMLLLKYYTRRASRFYNQKTIVIECTLSSRPSVQTRDKYLHKTVYYNIIYVHIIHFTLPSLCNLIIVITYTAVIYTQSIIMHRGWPVRDRGIIQCTTYLLPNYITHIIYIIILNDGSWRDQNEN